MIPNAVETARAQFLLTCDCEGSLLDLSAEGRRFTGASPAHYSGFRWLELVHADDRSLVVELIHTPSPSAEARRCRIRRFDGEFLWFEIFAESRSLSVVSHGRPGNSDRSIGVVLSATEAEPE